MAAIGSIWLSLLLLTAGWLFLVPVYERPLLGVGALLVLAGVVLASRWLRGTGAVGSDRALAVLAVPAVVAAMLLPFPYSLGPILVGAGCALEFASNRTRGRGRLADVTWPAATGLGRGALLVGVMATVQAAALTPYYAVASRYHEMGVFGRLGALLLRASGGHVATTPEGLLVDTGFQTLVYSFTWEKFGVLPLLLFLVGSIPVLVVGRSRRFAFPTLAVIILVFAEVRFALLVSMTALSGRIDAFWSRPVTILTLLPLTLIVWAVLPTKPPGQVKWPEAPLGNRRFQIATALALAAAVALVGALAFEEPGTPKAGRVVVEEGLSDWEWTTEEFDTEWYGEKSGYNYYNFYQYLDYHYEMDRNTGPITPEVLSECDVFILKVPTSALAAEEVESIVAFVQEGGGLFLIGDHTNVFGTSTNINPLAERFGLRFNYDATYGLATGELSEYQAPEILPHPIVQNLPGPFLFGTSASMQVAPSARAVIVDHGLKALDADYSQENFFSEVSISPEMRFGSFSQGAAVRYGRGRVAAFADSTVFSNFWMFVPGKPELLLSYVAWLDRTNGIPYARVLLLSFAVALAMAAVYVGRTLPRSAFALAVVIGLVTGVAVAPAIWGEANRLGYPLPDPRTDYTSICFEREYSKFALPDTLEGFMAEPHENLHTFYVWVQRLGYIPSVGNSLDDALTAGDVVVLVNPGGDVRSEDVEALVRYVEAGGRLLIADSTESPGSAAEAFLEPFGMDLGPRATGSLNGNVESGDYPLPLTDTARSVVGGTPMLAAETGDVVCAYARQGDGMVAVFGDSALFFNSSLGTTNMVPDLHQSRVAAIEFGLLRFLAEEADFAF